MEAHADAQRDFGDRARLDVLKAVDRVIADHLDNFTGMVLIEETEYMDEVREAIIGQLSAGWWIGQGKRPAVALVQDEYLARHPAVIAPWPERMTAEAWQDSLGAVAATMTDAPLHCAYCYASIADSVDVARHGRCRPSPVHRLRRELMIGPGYWPPFDGPTLAVALGRVERDRS